MAGAASLIRAVEKSDLDNVSGACWESRGAQLRLLDRQGILGMGVWEGDTCVGLLHCYSVTLPAWDDSDFPGYGRARPQSWPLGWPLLVAREQGLAFDRPVWGLACYHVGYKVGARGPDPAYFRKGIGAALLGSAVNWGREHGYAAILAHGGPRAVPAYNVWMGCLPWTSYLALGFGCLAMEEGGQRLPWWARAGGASPEAVAQVEEAVSAGKAPAELCARAMLLGM